MATEEKTQNESTVRCPQWRERPDCAGWWLGVSLLGEPPDAIMAGGETWLVGDPAKFDYGMRMRWYGPIPDCPA